jgi:signal transduction histidine kinase
MPFQKMTPREFEQVQAQAGSSSRRATSDTNLAFLRSLAAAGRTALSKLMFEETCEPGDIIFMEGDAGDAAYLIKAGRVAVITGDLSSPALLGRRGPGEIIGEMALLDNRPRSASVVALDKMHLLRINAEHFDELLEEGPEVSKSIMTSLSARLREATFVRDENEQLGRKMSSQLSTLRTEKQQLLELHRVRQETSGLIVHDLRNPLGLLYGAVQMLEITLPDEMVEENRELFEVVNASYGRMRRLVDSLLDVERMETGEVSLALTASDLSLLVKAASAPVALSMKKANIKFQTSFPEGLADVLVDEEMIIRVLANLIDNAIKYMPGGGKLNISAKPRGEWVAVGVSDTGPGIPAKDRDRIFERFTQVAGTRRPRGFGLGLAFCRLAVEAHGGKIRAESVEGERGCQFIFTLPTSRPTREIHDRG